MYRQEAHVLISIIKKPYAEGQMDLQSEFTEQVRQGLDYKEEVFIELFKKGFSLYAEHSKKYDKSYAAHLSYEKMWQGLYFKEFPLLFDQVTNLEGKLLGRAMQHSRVTREAFTQVCLNVVG